MIIVSGILLLLIVVIAVIAMKFNIALKKSLERFETYQNKTKTVETSYGKVTYIDEGKAKLY